MKKSFAQLQAVIKSDNEYSSLDKHSHFQFLHVFQTVETSLSQQSLKDIDLREVILLDYQSTVSLFCNPCFVTGYAKADNPLELQSNSGRMTVKRVMEIGDGSTKVWFSTSAITNILSLKMVRSLYPVSYDCDEASFTVHHANYGKLGIIFGMHHSGLHIYDPDGEVSSFVTTVDKNKLHFTKHQIDRAELAWTLYASLGFPSEHDFKWILQSNQIKDCPMTVMELNIRSGDQT